MIVVVVAGVNVGITCCNDNTHCTANEKPAERINFGFELSTPTVEGAMAALYRPTGVVVDVDSASEDGTYAAGPPFVKEALAGVNDVQVTPLGKLEAEQPRVTVPV